jgi:hypothetical protein
MRSNFSDSTQKNLHRVKAFSGLDQAGGECAAEVKEYEVFDFPLILTHPWASFRGGQVTLEFFTMIYHKVNNIDQCPLKKLVDKCFFLYLNNFSSQVASVAKNNFNGG